MTRSSTLLSAGRSLLRVVSNPTASVNTIRTISISSQLLNDARYKLSVKTGDVSGAGTDSKVYFRMIGEIGSSDEIMLEAQKEQMERGAIDHFEVVSEDVGRVDKVIIRHDNTGMAPGWYLEWVKVQDDKGNDYHFDCNAWLAKGEKTKIIKLLKASE